VAAVSVALAALALGACSAGARTSGDQHGGPPATTSTTAVAPATTSLPASTTTVVRADAGTATLRVTGLTLPASGAGGSGLRVVVRAASPRLLVRRTGGVGAVSACPVAGPTGGVDAGGCVEVGPAGVAVTAAAGGLDVRATGAEATLDELSVNYLPAARTTTIVTPARPAGACAARACDTTYSLLPSGPGPFVLDGRAAGGRPRLVLTSVAPSSNRTLATVEGGANLSIRATLEAGAEARLLHHEQEDGPIAPVTAEILWP
jgi:hypothetical protein